MYENSGTKIKGAATLLCACNFVLGIIVAAGIFALFDGRGAGVAIAIAVFGVFALTAWLSYLLLAGFGELVENSAAIAAAVNPQTAKATPASNLAQAAPSTYPRCGAAIKQGVSFCSKCGYDLL